MRAQRGFSARANAVPTELEEPTERVVKTLVDQAQEVSGMRVAGFVVESGVCVSVGGDGAVDPTVVSRAVAQGSTVTAREVVAIPITIDDEPVAVISSAARIGGEDMVSRLEFLAEMITARLRRPPADVKAAQTPDDALDDTGFRPIFDAANFALFVLDPDGIVLYANPYAGIMSGYPPEDMVGQSIAESLMYGPSVTEREIRAHFERLLHGHPSTGEMTTKVASGDRRTFTFTLNPVHDDAGRLTNILASAIDITERQAAEHSLHLANEALEQARIQAEKSSAARSEFLARMSHEIRTPLNAIIGTTTLMLDQIESDTASEHIEILRSSADHLLDVINDILDITKLETGMTERDDDSAFAVEALVESSLDLVMGKAAAKGLEVTSLVEPGTPPYLRGDAPRVRQILVNLLSNAVKYTDAGIIEIVGRGHYVSTDRVELVFEISDTGPGIAPDRLDTLFDPFVRGDDSFDGVEGAGLGLSISERLVHMLDGTITVQSQVGVGTRFTVSIPFQVHTPDNVPQTESHVEEFEGLKVLVVDDIELNRRVLELETRRWGMQPTLCTSGIDALALVDGGRRFDLALLDLNMPDMNGDELAGRLAERNDCPRVLLSSTSVEKPELFSACLHKPIKRHQLAHAIQRALAGRADATATTPDEAAGDRNLRILLAEDNVVNQKVADALLQRIGHTATIVSDGTDVLRELQERTYDVVLLDLRMPSLGGIDTAAEIVRHYGDERPRLVAFTASATDGDRERCFEVGMDDFVSKPVTLDGLRRVLADIDRRVPSR